MKKRTKIIIVTVMVLLLGVTGYLNIVLNNSINNNYTETTTSNYSYFASLRSNRESSREREIAILQAVVDSEASSSEERTNALNMINDILAKMEAELAVETQIRGLGYEDCIVTNNKGNVVAIIKTTGLIQDEADQIQLLLEQGFETTLEFLKIIEVK